MKKALLWIDVASTLVGAALAVRFGPRTLAWYAGLGLAAVSIALWITARLQLGSSFSVTAQARQLVTTGLYSRIRNPIYFFGGLANLGVVLALQVWWLYPVWAAMIPLQVLRVRRERKVLADAFGATYQEYRSKTWF